MMHCTTGTKTSRLILVVASLWLSLILLPSIAAASRGYSTSLDSNFFRSMRGKLSDFGQGSPVDRDKDRDRLSSSFWDALVADVAEESSSPVTTRSKAAAHWTDPDGFDCHESFSTASGTFHFVDSTNDDDEERLSPKPHVVVVSSSSQPGKEGQDDERHDDVESGGGLRFQKRESKLDKRGQRADDDQGRDEDKVPGFVVEDGFFKQIEDPLSS